MYSEYSAAIAAPPRRRRRPALSCVQCRRRKFKCDQKKPCSQCERSKDALCTYSSEFNNSQSRCTSQIQETSENPGRHHALGESFHILTPGPSTSIISATHGLLYTDPYISSESSIADSDARLSKNPPIDDPRVFNNKLPKDNLLPYMVYSPDIERHVIPSDMIPEVDKEERSSQLKMKLIGATDWMNQMTQVSHSYYSNRRRA